MLALLFTALLLLNLSSRSDCGSSHFLFFVNKYYFKIRFEFFTPFWTFVPEMHHWSYYTHMYLCSWPAWTESLSWLSLSCLPSGHRLLNNFLPSLICGLVSDSCTRFFPLGEEGMFLPHRERMQSLSDSGGSGDNLSPLPSQSQWSHIFLILI